MPEGVILTPLVFFALRFNFPYFQLVISLLVLKLAL